MNLGRNLREVNAHLELLARSHTAWGLVGRVAAESSALNRCFVGPEGDEVKPQQIAKRRLKLLNLFTKLKFERRLGIRRKAAFLNLGIQVQSLAIDGRQFACILHLLAASAVGFKLRHVPLDLAQAAGKP